MTAPIKFPKGRFAGMNTPARKRQDTMERMAEQYKQGAAQTDIDNDVPESSVDVGKDYDMFRKVRRKTQPRYPGPK